MNDKGLTEFERKGGKDSVNEARQIAKEDFKMKIKIIENGEIENKSGEWNDELIRVDNGKKIFEKAKTLYKVIDKNSNSSEVPSPAKILSCQ